jgi:hypothetical protein
MLEKTHTTHVCDDIFDDLEAWHFVSEATNKRLKIHPNKLAHNEKCAALAVVVNQSKSGSDHGLSQGSLEYLETTHELTDGTAVEAAFVVYCEPDRNARNRERPYRIVCIDTAEQARERVRDLPLEPAKFAGWSDFWWIRLSNDEVRF